MFLNYLPRRSQPVGFLLILLLGLILFLGSSFLVKPETIEITPPPKETQVVANEKITIMLVGDIMLDRGVKYMVEKHGGGDFRFPFLKIADELKRLRPSHHPPAEGGPLAKLLFGNLEGVISDKGVRVGSIYSFRADPKAILGLSFAGFNVLSLANNHAFDYTSKALEDCLTKLNDTGIGYVGAGFTENEAYSPLIKEINGSTGSPQVKIAFLAYTNLGPETWKATETNSGIAWISEKKINKIKEDIKLAKEKADILIVSLHSGEEYLSEPTHFQIDFSKMAIEAGADLIVGHHPHVVQKNEKYKNGYIFYSLGNFIFDQGFSEKTMRGQIIEVLIENKQIKEIIAKEIEINNFFQPEILD